MIKGAAYFVWAPITTESTTADPVYGAGFQLGGLNQVDRKINYAEAELPADDKVKYKAREFSTGALSVKLSEFSLANKSAVFGQTLTDGKLSARSTDIAPTAGIGYINTVGTKDGSGNDTTVYRVYINPKTQASQGDISATSKGTGISMSAEDFTATIFNPEYAEWEIVKEFDTLAAAKGYIDSYLNVATFHAVDVMISGAGAGEAGSPEGVTMVADESAFVLTITGTADALYDNGVDVTSSIAAGKYTLASVTAAHDIALVFTPA